MAPFTVVVVIGVIIGVLILAGIVMLLFSYKVISMEEVKNFQLGGIKVEKHTKDKPKAELPTPTPTLTLNAAAAPKKKRTSVNTRKGKG